MARQAELWRARGACACSCRRSTEQIEALNLVEKLLHSALKRYEQMYFSLAQEPLRAGHSLCNPSSVDGSSSWA